MAASGPVPPCSSTAHWASPGPNVTQLENSAAHAVLQGLPGAAGGGMVHPSVHTDVSGPVKVASSWVHAASPGPKSLQLENSATQGALHAPPAGAEGAESVHDGVQRAPSGPMPEFICAQAGAWVSVTSTSKWPRRRSGMSHISKEQNWERAF